MTNLDSPKPSIGVPSSFISVPLSLMIVGLFAATSEELRHVCALALLIYGAVVLRDAVDWVRGAVDVFDPVGLMSLLATKGFVGNLLQLSQGLWISHVEHPPDWRPWVGWMTLLNCGGYLIFRYSAKWVGGLPRYNTTSWQISRERFQWVSLSAVLVSATVYLLVIVRFGGVSGYVSMFESGGGFQGMGLVFMLSEALPVLVFMALVVHWKNKAYARNWVFLASWLAAFFLMQLIVGGLRGSRSNTIWAAFWAVGMIHHWIRPVPRKAIVVGLVCLIPFLYMYGFYKRFGRAGIRDALASTEARQAMSESRAGEGKWYARFVGGGTQTFTLYRICREDSDYQYAWGRTYLGGAAKLVPSFIWRSRPIGKRKEGTEVLHGAGTYPDQVASQVWGLAGEAMLNFGPLSVPFVYVIPGVFAGMVRRGMASWPAADTRWLIQPFLITMTMAIIYGDSDNLAYFAFKNGLLPCLVVFMGSVSLRRVLVPSIHRDRLDSLLVEG